MKRIRFIPWILFAMAAWLGLGGCASYSRGPQASGVSREYRSAGYPGVAGGMPVTTASAGEATVDHDAVMEPAPMDEMDGGGGDMAPPAELAAKQAEAPAAPPAPKPAEATTPANGLRTGQSPSAATSDRRQPILIYTADFTLSVYEVKKSLDALEGLAKSVGGFVARRDDRSITLRVPAQDFQAAVIELEKLGDVISRNVVAEDVTAEYRDLEVQLQNLVALRARFEKLLEKAQKVEEALSIERELGRITGEIERIKGRIKVLNDQAQYSTITVVFQPRSSQQIQDGPFILPLPWLNGLGLPRLLAL